MRKVVLAIGGSSGSSYAEMLMNKLKDVPELELGIVMSKNAITNWELEIGTFSKEDWPFRFYENNDFFAPFASGSAQYDTMVICPCSMGIIGRIASGVSNDLTTRAADVILKERRNLILVPRETPYNLIHIENMLKITQAGGVVAPATPSFYSNPTSKAEILATVVDRIIDLMGIQIDTYRWSE